MIQLRKTYKYCLIVGVIWLMQSCKVTSYIPEDEYLYTGSNIEMNEISEIENINKLENEIENVLYPEPNSSFMGMKLGLYYHYKAQNENAGFITKFINKKIGEEPVYLSDVNYNNTERLIENRLINRGIFNSEISLKISKDTGSKEGSVEYTVLVTKPYTVANYRLEIDSVDQSRNFPIYQDIKESFDNSFIKAGEAYNLAKFKAERERIDQYLKRKGYYNFNPNFLLFQVDTNLNDNKTFNLYVKLKKGVPAKAKVPYVVRNITVYPDVSDTNLPVDSTQINGIYYVQHNVFFKPEKLNPFILIKPNTLYDPVESKYTSRRISSIGAYKFVNINYIELDSTINDSLNYRYLDAEILLSPLNKRSVQAELKAVTKSNNFTGPNLNVSYLNRNLFKGGENFTTSGNIGYEKQFGNNTNGSNALQLGITNKLTFPRLLLPGNTEQFFRHSIPKTTIRVSIDHFRRSDLYTLNSYSTSFGYSLNVNRFVTHTLNPIEVNYIQLRQRSEEFNNILDQNPFLRRSFEQQFIAGLTYSFLFSEMNEVQKKGRLNFQFNFEIAGNALNLMDDEQNNPRTFLGVEYSQFVKGDIDLSYNYALDKIGQALAGRIFAGLGVPYGNSASLPFVKQFFSGGAYSVRAFQIRGLGPGTYQPTDGANLFFDRSGDIRLEANLEYRFPIYSVLKGAVFADAGNIWNLNDNLEGGKFSSNFINELGVGTGLGLRVDVQGFVIRFDVAAPLTTPTTNWNFDYENPVFNFAVGYPF